LNTINRVLNKYGGTVEQTMAYRRDIGAKIAELSRATEDQSSLDKQIAPLQNELDALGRKLSAKRRAAANRLVPLVHKQLSELGMDKARFTIALDESPAPGRGADHGATASGYDQIEFVIQTNPGQLAQPLRKIASGGELSRIMLALKSLIAGSDRISVLVFDEIDANVGGRLGAVIGNKLRQLASHHQVLCITHLPQIACYADRHLTVRKNVTGDTTQTTVRTVDGVERLEELAEMIGGQRVTDTTRAQARELLESAHTQASTHRRRTSGATKRRAPA
jgi:DNA repair protein RecN (Recombination protein N)